ncbi:ankyrin repeat domain-containing protein [Wolbachia endosymbiont (group A) of Pogonocherus hispidulus]|uniref:ankyrin repeat domain-containing protein n=1 Tax=Wolbachia endosymbiont (group A) of Pogonocherus hispidulus TaxID=3066136 RepID=UPI00333FD019
MNEEEALKILGITNLSDFEIVEQAKQRLNELYKSNFTTLSYLLKKDDTEELSKKIEACKFIIGDQQDQVKVFSDLVILAINDDKMDFLKLLLETVKNDDKFNYLNTEGTGGNMPLNFVLGYTSYKHESRVKAIDLLLKHGADPNTRNREGKSPLHCVINNSDGTFCHKVTELLLNYNASPDAEDNQGKTPLHYLFEDGIHNHVEIAKLLLKRGANLYIQNERGESLLYKVYSEKRDDIVKLLLEHSASSDIKSERVQSLLRKACSEGRDNIVKLLLEHGANPDVKDQKGRSLFYYIIDSYRIDDRYKVVEFFG